MAEPKKRRGEHGPDKVPRKNSPRVGKRATGPTPPDLKPGAVRRTRALLLLVEGQSPYQIAPVIGVSVQTIYDWLKRPEFADELARRLEESVAAARRTLLGAAQGAATALVKMSSGDLVVDDGDDEGDRRPQRAPRVDTGRVRAAEAVLNRVGLAASQTVTLAGGVDLTLPDMRAYTPEQLAAMAGDDAKPTTKTRK